MPLYEFRCPAGHVTEKITRDTTLKMIECPTCGAEAVKMVSSSSFELKGSGWASDGYGK